MRETSLTPTPHSEIDLALKILKSNAAEWAGLAIGHRVEYLTRVAALVSDHAEEWAHASIHGKQIPPGSQLEGEEWVSGPYPTVTWLHECAATLKALADGADPLAGVASRTRAHGQVVSQVYPTNIRERLLLSGYRVDVWMDPEVMLEGLRATVGTAYRGDPRPGRVALVLGAGNISSIAALDLLYKLIADLEVVMVKLNPVNEYLGPVFETVFAPLIDDGFLCFVYGGADVGAYLTAHDDVDTVHLTGSARTHDSIVFGPGEEGRERRRTGQPILIKPISSELGGVSPTIVVPGPWGDADVQFQAEHLATQKLHNSGFNCIASQVLVLPEGWSKTEALIARVREILDSAADRPAYYPGTEIRRRAAAENHPGIERLGPSARRSLITGVDSASDSYCFREEFFAPIYATTTLAAPSAAEFLRNAVEFCNVKLAGTLGANIIIHPRTAKELGPELEQAVADLRYGSVGINVWTGLAYLVTRAPWGAAPGHTTDDVGSGIGFVHNSMLFDRPQKAVAWGPFYNFPRNLLHGEIHMSPRPPWFVTNKSGGVTSRLLTHYAMDGKLRRLPGIFASALRG